MNDVYPRIIYDLGIGEFLRDISFNTQAISTYMRSRGFTDEQIAAVRINVSVDDPEDETPEDRETFMTPGSAYKTEMLIKLYPKAVLRLIAAGRLSENKDTRDLFNSETETNIYASERFSTTLAHEIEHLKIELEGGMPGPAGNRGPTSEDMSEGDKEYQAYLEQPEEIRCREAAEGAPKNFVSIAYKIDSENG